MEVPELNCPASPARDQPALAPGTPAAPGQQASPHLTLGPIILPPEQSLAPTVFLKALPIPLYHTVPPGGLQPRAPLVTGSVDGGSVPFILSPLLQPEGPGPAQVGKPVTPTVTVNIVGTLPVLSPGPTLGSPGKARKAGKYLCPHCGRDCLKPSVLEKHVRSHTGERPFPCATCGIAFKTQSNLYKHRRTQTHLNNSRLSVGSDGAGGSLLEEGDKAAETPGAAGRGDSGSVGGGDGARSERPLSPGVQGSGHCLVPPMHLPPIAKSLDLQAEALFCPVSTLADREAPLDATHAAPVGTPLGSAQCGRKPPGQNIQEPWCLHSTSFVLHPNGRPELGSQLPPVSRPLKGGDLEAPRLVFPDPKLEGGPRSGGDTQGPWQQALAVPTPPSRSSGEPQPAGDKLPSEKKKLRVEQLGSLGVRDQAPGGPAQDSSPPSLNQDSDSGDRLHTSADGRGASGTSFSAPLVALRPAGPGPKAPVCGPAAGAPGGTASLPAQPSDTTFPPKYLLRLPQGETPQLLAGDPERSQGPLCRSELPQDPTSSAGPGLGTLPATRLAPGGANNFGEDSSWPRLWDRRKEVPGEEKGDLDTSTPAAGESPGWSVGVPRETASALPTPPCDPGRSETRDAGQLCVGSMWARAWPSGGVLSPWTLSREVAGSPGPLAGHRPCRPLEPSSILPAPLPSGCPERAWSRISESSGLCGPQGPFPLLRAEPRLTWCCLSGSLPLPREQKERATSAYWALHCPGSSAPAQGADVRPVSKAESGRRTGTSPAGGGETQPWKLSCPTAPGMTSGDPGSEPGWTKGPPRRRAKMCRGSSKQKALRRYRGSFLQGRVRLRASRLRKPLWVLRRDCHLPQLEGLDPRRTLGQASSEMAGLSLQGESSCAATASPLGCGDREKEEKAWRPTPGGSFPSTRPRAVRDRDTWTVQDTVPSAGACGDRCPQNAAVGSGLALPSDSRMHMGDHSLPSCGKGLDPGMPETQRLPSQEPVSADPKPRAFSEAQEPLAFESKGSSPRHDTATSVAAIGTSLGTGGGHTTPGAPSAEPQGQGRAAGETQTQSSPASKALAQGLSPSLWPGKPSPGRRLSGSVPSRSPGKAHPDTPTSGPGPAGSQQEEGRPEVCCLPGGQEEGAPPPGCALECGEVLAPRPPAGKDTEETPESGLMALKDGVVPSTPGQPAGAQEASSKTIKKRSLGGMRKQTRVEFSDTSSDDEDRLVIEI
ncbi:Zinc finger protein 831 [Myotis davidii]|uniref:Zinc finger protein 831 n=1 Tax=Myotis davidii TaxID=225400 RepID=L5LQ11_MYODS|nr:Zinc finger protein 831 [Myotis davidii]